MRFRFLIIPSVLVLQVAEAQNGSASLTANQGTTTSQISTPVSTPASPSVSAVAPVSPADPATPASPATTQTLIMDYKSVFEAATVEEEVKMAAERFNLSPSQQDIWLTAATDRRIAEKTARAKLDSKDQNLMKEPVYRGLRTSLNTFHETIVGYLTPTQKQALETDRLIQEEKRQRMAKLPPPPPTPTVVPVDSSAIKAAEIKESKGKKSKKKKKPAVGQ